ncbi:hypothetical protein DSM106972_008820 [Dulcicalothrix desertica PCC 7102]|uniref:DUF5615 domain-containing protein n=1 Tax=Dulcicalothrix desertica PCC 7102 TaxID=232991 RepID=A0A3S1CQX5_9CYAN|nr:hypothetical protein [Dulcicalothrix desertica]RUT08829.1 hypothetical protein DSM106972_008820 [Dulcicalothrix desertica PCC 7102]TWH44153.1 hypothetical protein CAL7102_07935 [Dulcicalothrix desertica PCC 7102]
MARLYADEQFPRIVSELHRANPNHAGIIVITNDMDRSRMATRINEAITVSEPLSGKLIRVVRPS